MRSQHNALFPFLTEDPPHAHLVMGETVLEYEVKKAFERYLNKLCGKLDPQTFTQADPNWRVIKPKLCKHCEQEHKKNCCANYKRSDRTSGPKMITNMSLSAFDEKDCGSEWIPVC